MKKNKIKTKKMAQEIQNDIFRNMSNEKKLALWVLFWKINKSLSGNKLYEYNRRSATTVDSGRKNS